MKTADEIEALVDNPGPMRVAWSEESDSITRSKEEPLPPPNAEDWAKIARHMQEQQAAAWQRQQVQLHQLWRLQNSYRASRDLSDDSLADIAAHAGQVVDFTNCSPGRSEYITVDRRTYDRLRASRRLYLVFAVAVSTFLSVVASIATKALLGL